jgi:hypothetical protein
MNDCKADCYSAGERAAMIWGQELRERWLAPLLDALTACRVSANFVTLLSLASGLAFCVVYFTSQPWAFACLALHVFFDGLDGPLARNRLPLADFTYISFHAPSSLAT